MTLRLIVLILFLSLRAVCASARLPYCFQSFVYREASPHFDLLDSIRKNGIDPEKIYFRVMKSVFISEEKEAFTSYFVYLYSSRDVANRSKNYLGSLVLVESAKDFPRFIYSTSIGVSTPGTGLGTFLYLLGARMSEEFYQRPLGTVSKEATVNGTMALKHSQMARHAWERMHTQGWAHFLQTEILDTPHEFFIFDSAKVTALTKDIWKLFQKNRTYVKEKEDL